MGVYHSFSCLEEVDRAISLLSTLKEKRRRLGDEAYLVVHMEVTSLLLKRVTPGHAAAADASAREAELDAVRAEIDAGKKILDSLVDAENVTTATYFRVASEYHKVAQLSRAACVCLTCLCSCCFVMTGLL